MTDSPYPGFDTSSDGSSNLSAGDVVDDRFEIRRLVGEGAFGRVYEAFDLHLSRRVALKVVYTDGSPEQLHHFDREVALIKQVEHGNVVRLYDFGASERNQLYMSMEFVDGISLDKLAEQGPIDVERAVGIVYQILDALTEAHRYGVIHRDMKPHNIILTDKGARRDVVKLLDFGLARAFEDGVSKMGASGPLTGTPLYMPPEQIEDGITGVFTDIYAVGLIFLEMVTGRPVFASKKLIDVFAEKLGQDVAMPPELPEAYHAVVERAVARNYRERFATPLDMYDAIQVVARKVAAGIPIVRPPTIRRLKALDPSFFDVETSNKLQVAKQNTGKQHVLNDTMEIVDAEDALHSTIQESFGEALPESGSFGTGAFEGGDSPAKAPPSEPAPLSSVMRRRRRKRDED